MTFVTQAEIQNNKDHKEDVENEEHEEHDPYFEPIIHLPEVHIYSMEEDEEDLIKLYFFLTRRLFVHYLNNIFFFQQTC